MLIAASCSADTATEVTSTSSVAVAEATTPASIDEAVEVDVTGSTAAATTELAAPTETSTYQIEVWADNWMAVFVDGVLIGEDSVSITTERSFNAETFAFDAALPFTVAIEAKDFKETDSGLEYIGQQNQQMGDGGIIAQITDLTTGEIVGATNSDWVALVVHQAPLNQDCEDDPDPDSTCEYLIIDTPPDWTTPEFDDTNWARATEWAAADVSPKDGYNEISWDPSARLIWGTDLEIDNTVLLRTTVS